VKLCRTAIPRGIRDLYLLARQQMGEQCRQLVMMQLEAVDVPTGLAVEVVLTAQDPPAIGKLPNARPSGTGHLGQRFRQRSGRQSLPRVEQARVRRERREGVALPNDRRLAFEQQSRAPIGAQPLPDQQRCE